MAGCSRLTSGLTLVETVISILLIALLFSILLPALSSARSASYRDRCHDNQKRIGQAWELYLQEHDQQFPTVPLQPGWMYAGVRFSPIGNLAFPDNARPLTPYLPCPRTHDRHEIVWCCPADHGINDSENPRGTRSAFRNYGTSYRANAALLFSQVDANGGAEPDLEFRGLRRSEITTAPSRLLVQGDAFWHEIAEGTGRTADWHGEPGMGNLLFLDGSVRFLTVRPREVPGPVVFDPRSRSLPLYDLRE